MRNTICFLLLLILCAGCAASKVGTRTVEIISEPPGAGIEINGVYKGKAPLKVSVTAMIHDDESYGCFARETFIKASPTAPDQSEQTRLFQGYDGHEGGDPIPKRIVFDMEAIPGLDAEAGKN